MKQDQRSHGWLLGQLWHLAMHHYCAQSYPVHHLQNVVSKFMKNQQDFLILDF